MARTSQRVWEPAEGSRNVWFLGLKRIVASGRSWIMGLGARAPALNPRPSNPRTTSSATLLLYKNI